MLLFINIQAFFFYTDGTLAMRAGIKEKRLVMQHTLAHRWVGGTVNAVPGVEYALFMTRRTGQGQIGFVTASAANNNSIVPISF